MTLSMALSGILRADATLTALLATYEPVADTTAAAIFAGRVPPQYSDVYNRIEIWEIYQDNRLIGAPMVQVSIRAQAINTGVAEMQARKISAEVLRILDGYLGEFVSGNDGVAINACSYMPGGQNLLEDGGVLHCPLTFRIQTNTI